MSNLGNQQLGSIILGLGSQDITAGYGQAQAYITGIEEGFGQAQAQIKQIYFAHAQAQALITGDHFGQGQAQADIKQTYYGFGQANAHISKPEFVHGLAQASIRTIILDVVTESIMTASGTSHNFQHTPVGVPRAIVVSIVGLGVSPFTTSVTYGGVAMRRMARGADSATETGHVDLWFLGRDIPVGEQTVEATFATITGNDFQFVAMSFLAGGDTEEVFSGATGGDETNPYLVATNFSRISQGIIATFSGVDAPSSISEQTGWTLVHDHDFTSQSAEVARQDVPSDQDVFAGFTIALDDNAFAVLTFSEAIPHPQAFGQALALIKSRFASGNAQAFIRTGTNVVAQAQAYITPTIDVNVYGQAQAFMIGWHGWGQAQAYILLKVWGWGQANAQIVGLQHGQAQALIANAGTSIYYNAVQGDTPAAYYRFTETVVAADTGIAFLDSAGDHDLSKFQASRGPISIADGILNTTETKGIDNKTTDTTPYNGNYLQYSGTSPITSKYNWALEVWIKPTQTTVGQSSTNILSVGAALDTVSFGTSTAGAINIYRSGSDGRVTAAWFAVTNGSGGSLSNNTSINPVMPTTEFTHAVLTRGTGDVKLYVNGVLVDTADASNMIDPALNVTINGNISTNATIRYHLDEVAVYAHELLPEDILEHLRIGSGKNVWYGQAQAMIYDPRGYGQARAQIKAFDVEKTGLARAFIRRPEQFGNALARIKLEAHNTTNAYQDMIIADNPVAYYRLNDSLEAGIPSSGGSTTDTDYENKALDVIGSYDLTRLFSGTGKGPIGGQSGIPFLDGVDSAVINRPTVIPGNDFSNGLVRDTDPFAVVEPIPITGPAINWALELWFKVLNNNGQITDISIMKYGERDFIAGYVGLKYSYATGKVIAELRTGSLNTMGLSGPVLEPQQWHHVVLTRGIGDSKLYVDGVLIENAFINLHNFVRDILIGGQNNTDDGQIYYDESAIYNHELTSDRVGAHYLLGMNKWNGYGQAAALIAANRPVGQAQAAIQKNGYGFGHAKARIIKGPFFGRAQANARIKIVGLQGYGQAQAFIQEPVVGPYGQAQAVIGNERFRDTFTRNVPIVPEVGTASEPLGIPDFGTYSSDSGVLEAVDSAEIDGARFVKETSDDNEYGYLITNEVVADGVFSIDFKWEVIPDYAFVSLERRVILGGTDRYVNGYYTRLDGDDIIGITFSVGSPETEETLITALEDGEIYTLKVAIHNLTVSVKVWKTSEPEPVGWILTETTALGINAYVGRVAAYIEEGEGTPPYTAYLDNFNAIDTTVLPTGMGLGLALASIRDDGRGYGNAMALINRSQQFGNAKAQIRVYDRPVCGNAQAEIAYKYQGSGQAAAMIARPAHGQAMAAIQKDGFGFGNAMAWIVKFKINRSAQAQARIRRYGNLAWGQANAQIRQSGRRGCGQAQAVIKGNHTWGQARAWIAYGNTVKTGQARAKIDNKTRYGQANALILAVIGPGPGPGPGPGTGGGGSIIVPAQTYLVEYNGYMLPGFAQSESFESSMQMKSHVAAMVDGSLTEYMGLENKLISLEMRVWDSDYIQVKKQIQKAGVILRSKRDNYAKLKLQRSDRYYEALVKKITTDKEARSSNFIGDYEVQFECQPWLKSEEEHTLTGTGLIDTDQVSRTFENGGWTPVILTLTGTNITVSGYTNSEPYTGYISLSGSVNTEIDTDNGTYELYVGPDKTYFNISGASSCTIRYRDRWYL